MKRDLASLAAQCRELARTPVGRIYPGTFNIRYGPTGKDAVKSSRDWVASLRRKDRKATTKNAAKPKQALKVSPGLADKLEAMLPPHARKNIVRADLSALAQACRELAAISLGREVPDYLSDLPSVKPKTPQKMRTEFPSLHLWEAPAETWEMPEEGEAVIKYRVTSREKRQSRDNGEEVERHSLTLEIQEIEPVGEADAEGEGVKAFGAVAALRSLGSMGVKKMIRRYDHSPYKSVAEMDKQLDTLMAKRRWKENHRMVREHRNRLGLKDRVSADEVKLTLQMAKESAPRGQRKYWDSRLKGMSALAERCRELRLRDKNGEFVPSAAGAADPRLHAAAYDPPGKRASKEAKRGRGAAAFLASLKNAG